MSLKRLSRLSTSLSVRLTAGFLVTFSVCLTILLFLSYVALRTFYVTEKDPLIRYELEEAAHTFSKLGEAELLGYLEGESEEFNPKKYFYRLITRNGEVRFSSDVSSWDGIPAASQFNGETTPGAISTELATDERLDRQIRLISLPLNQDLILQGGTYLSTEIRQLTQFKIILPLIGIMVTVLAGVTGYLMVRSAVGRVEEVTAVANSISAANLDDRLPASGRHDEIYALMQTFNRMLDRISNLVVSLRQVTEDLAHELRTPIARIRAKAELVLVKDQVSEASESLAENTIEECDKLLALVNTVLDLAEVDSATYSPTTERVDVYALLERAVELFESLVLEKNITLTLEPDEGAAFVLGDALRLERVFSNLIDNAIKYTPQGGSVRIVAKIEDCLRVTITDSGIGIPPEHLGFIFNRFYRVAESRSERGNGLGLSVVQSLVKAHGGQVTIASEGRCGTTVEVCLPLAES